MKYQSPIAINEVKEIYEEHSTMLEEMKHVLEEAPDKVINSHMSDDHEGTLKLVLDSLVMYMKHIGASIDYKLQEITVWPDRGFLFESLAAMPYYFPEINVGDKFKLIINGKHSYDVIFRGKMNQSNDCILHVGWMVDLIPVEPVERVMLDIYVNESEE